MYSGNDECDDDGGGGIISGGDNGDDCGSGFMLCLYMKKYNTNNGDLLIEYH